MCKKINLQYNRKGKTFIVVHGFKSQGVYIRPLSVITEQSNIKGLVSCSVQVRDKKGRGLLNPVAVLIKPFQLETFTMEQNIYSYPF
jgi:hypothetical protein